jgi:hypothetical protein
MMHQMFLSSAMVVTFLLTPQIMAAQEPERHGPPSPEMLFGRLDANHDGMISEEELPANAPEPLNALLKVADKDGDKNVSQEEFTAALKDHPLPRPPFAAQGEPGQPPCHMPPPPGMPMPMVWMPMAWMPVGGMPSGMIQPFPSGGPGMGFPPHGPQGPPHAGPQGKAPDPKELFQKLDKDNDGNLTLDEFTNGMNQLHNEMIEHARPMAGMPGPNGPIAHRGPGPGIMRGCPIEGRCPLDKPAGKNPPPDFRRDGRTLDSRIEALEAKLKAVEAKLEAN